MSYTYTHFIKQNIAPKGAKAIGVYDKDGNRICGMGLGGLKPLDKQKSYSFGLVSDIHLYKDGVSWVTWNPNEKFNNALTYFEKQGCAFCVVSGDLTQTGFFEEIESGDYLLDESQMAKYKGICDAHTIPVYELAGNHESYYEQHITNNPSLWKKYSGENALDYTVMHGDDLFILLGQPKGNAPMSDEALQRLYQTLEANRNKRCFIFVHPHISSGNPLGAYSSNPIFDWWGTKTTAFKNLLRHYKNTVVFHGHSHTKFECQEVDIDANYSTKDGFKSVHVPSLARPREIVNGALSDYLNDGSQGYTVDVYDDCIVLNGTDFINENPVPLGVYKIDTTLQTILANTFTDSTGIIRTASV